MALQIFTHSVALSLSHTRTHAQPDFISVFKVWKTNGKLCSSYYELYQTLCTSLNGKTKFVLLQKTDCGAAILLA